MTNDPVVLDENMELNEAIVALNARRVRRAPLVDVSGRLTGIVTLDDLLPALAGELGSLATLMSMQASAEGDHRRPASAQADTALA